MLGGPNLGIDGDDLVPGEATACGRRPDLAVIEAVVFGLIDENAHRHVASDFAAEIELLDALIAEQLGRLARAARPRRS